MEKLTKQDEDYLRSLGILSAVYGKVAKPSLTKWAMRTLHNHKVLQTKERIRWVMTHQPQLVRTNTTKMSLRELRRHVHGYRLDRIFDDALQSFINEGCLYLISEGNPKNTTTWVVWDGDKS